MDFKICVVGLGYVGLPLALAFGKLDQVIGFDIKEKRIQELKSGVDNTNECSSEDIKSSNVLYTSDPSQIKNANFIIIAVPTPVDKFNIPDFSPLIGASKIVGENLTKGAIVTYESTVYPGCSEEICVPLLERHSGLKCGADFKIGYSPERVNPGDKEHSIERITKVVSGMDEQTAEIVAYVYGQIIKAGVHKASSIKVAEAAKIIENVQRDLNIALMNELSIIFHKIGIDTKEVLAASSTKWNFNRYFPGLVGGHCIGVDPYYLTYKAVELGYHPQVILAGRRINDDMHKFVVQLLNNSLNKKRKPLNGSKVLLLGLTFKENVKDHRNSRIKYLIDDLKINGCEIVVCDPMVDDDISLKEFGVLNSKIENLPNDFDAVILAVKHNQFKMLTLNNIKSFMNGQPVLIDVMGLFDKKEAIKEGFIYDGL